MKTRNYLRGESLHYYAAGEVVHREGQQAVHHRPARARRRPRAIWLSNSNSQIANTKYHYNVVFNTLPRQECVVVNEWWWSGSCEYADIVYGVDSWMELKYPDMTASNTNPFLQVFPRTPLRRNFGTVSDLETYAGVAGALGHAHRTSGASPTTGSSSPTTGWRSTSSASSTGARPARATTSATSRRSPRRASRRS